MIFDLSAAFDTVDHTILLHRLKNIGIAGVVYDWFGSYLSDRTQVVHISVLGAILFNIYTQPIGEIASRHDVKCHFYADDTQLYISFSVKESSTAGNCMSNCIADIRSWMQANLLMLNDSKTEVILLGTKQQLSKLSNLQILVGSAKIKSCDKVRNLGVIFDNNMTMHDYVNNICKTSYFYIHLLGKLEKFFDKNTAAMVTHAFVTSRLDYCNSALWYIKNTNC